MPHIFVRRAMHYNRATMNPPDHLSADQLTQWDQAYVWHPFTPMDEYCREGAPVIVAGEGFFLIDAAGQRYLDGVSSLWCNVHGHRVPEIDAAVREQLDRIAHSTLLGLANEPSVRLARALVELAPAGLNRVFYSDSGATAVEAALKICFQYQQQKPGATRTRTLFVALGGAYHGDTLGSVSVGGVPLFHQTYASLLFKTLRVPAPVSYRVPPGFDRASWLDHCYAELERTLREHHAQIAGFVIEPLVQGASGILVHPRGYLRRVRDLTAEYDIPLIADEVAVGFGRTGSMFACEQEAVRPDLLCLAKGLTGGYLPLAATLATDEIYSAFCDDPLAGKTFFHGHTYTGNPLGCAAALASLRLFAERDVLANARRIADRLRQRLAEIADQWYVGEIRQQGTMVGIELVRDRATQEPFDPALRLGRRITLAARRRGVILRPLGD
ncbi:MAG TPA: adenosylmethionine--8-amino-7-oxononanoate transaminase, partial [Planctomycetaceae bacterium]|nr:adenosylmethionine--8-amino-7-oxononanoate transaminase [Planctomycetaceae bacterium]